MAGKLLSSLVQAVAAVSGARLTSIDSYEGTVDALVGGDLVCAEVSDPRHLRAKVIVNVNEIIRSESLRVPVRHIPVPLTRRIESLLADARCVDEALDTIIDALRADDEAVIVPSRKGSPLTVESAELGTTARISLESTDGATVYRVTSDSADYAADLDRRINLRTQAREEDH